MEYQEIRPNVIDPDMQPAMKNGLDLSAQSSAQTAPSTSRGIFTTVYENKMIVLGVIIVVIVIAIITYFFVRREPTPAPPTAYTPMVSQQQAIQAAQQQAMQAAPPAAPPATQPRQATPSREELVKILKKSRASNQEELQSNIVNVLAEEDEFQIQTSADETENNPSEEPVITGQGDFDESTAECVNEEVMEAAKGAARGATKEIKCSFILANGNQCKNPPYAGSDKCHRHQ